VPLGPVGVNVDDDVVVGGGFASAFVVDVDDEVVVVVVVLLFFFEGVGVRGFETLYVVVIRVCVCVRTYEY